MPNGSILPFIISLGLFVVSFGLLYREDYGWGLPAIVVGFIITLGAMFLRSVIDDHGYHIHKEDLIDDNQKGGKV